MRCEHISNSVVIPLTRNVVIPSHVRVDIQKLEIRRNNKGTQLKSNKGIINSKSTNIDTGGCKHGD